MLLFLNFISSMIVNSMIGSLKGNPSYEFFFYLSIFSSKLRNLTTLWKEKQRIMILNSAQCCMAEGVRRVTREKLESVIFTDDDMLAPNPFHNRSLCVEAEMNGVAVKRVMVDPDSASHTYVHC